MANEIWGPIKTPIKNQIELRQRLMSQNSNYQQRMTYLNKKCDIRVTPLSYDVTNENAYSNFIFNNDYIEGAIGNSYKNKTEKPFVENFELENRTGGNDKVGVIRTGKMSIKIFTREQFNLIEKYFRIGSAILIEWGWGSYVLSGGSIGYFKANLYNENAIKNTKILNENDILSHIETKTLESEGNYDAAIMFITNFNVSFENGVNDFYYTLNIDFVGKSLLLNDILANKADNKNDDNKNSNDPEKIFTNSLINLFRYLETRENEESLNFVLSTVVPLNIDDDSVIQDNMRLNIRELLKNNNTDISEIKENIYFFDQPNTTIRSVSYNTSVLSQESGPGIRIINEEIISTTIYSYNFISLKYFLKLIDNFININFLYTPLSKKYIVSKYEYLFSSNIILIDSDGERFIPGDNIKTSILINSFDTRICILPHQLLNNIKENKIEDIYLRVTYLKDLLISLVKSNEDFNLNNILTKLINDINKATANEIKLEYYPEEEAGYYTIISNNSFEIEPETRNNLLSLKIYDRSAVGSIVEEVNIDTTIDSKVANTMAIASLGQPLNEIPNETFGLLKFNKNIRSRLRLSNNINENQNRDIELRLANNIEFLEKNIPQLLKFNDSKINFDTDDVFEELIRTFNQVRTDIINLSLLNKNTDSIPRNTPLIPVLYTFSIPGISGLYNTSTLKIIDERLPDIYKTTNSYFIITGVKHTINNREWKTSVKTNFQLS